MFKFFAFLVWWLLAGTGTFDRDWKCDDQLVWKDGVGYGYVCEYIPGYRLNDQPVDEEPQQPEHDVVMPIRSRQR